MDGVCGMYGGRRGGYRVLVGKPEGRSALDLGVYGRVVLKMDAQE